MEPTSYETRETPLLIGGLGMRVTLENRDSMPKLWERFARIGSVEGRIGAETYGVSITAEGNGFVYVAGVAVADFAPLPKEFERLRVAASRFAVFAHSGDIRGLHGLIVEIGRSWTPPANGSAPRGPFLIERYAADFDRQHATGKVDVLIPI